MCKTLHVPASTGASVHVYPSTPTHTTIHLPRPLCATVHPTSAHATDLLPATNYSTAISTPVLADTHKVQVDVSTPAPTGVQQLSCSLFHLPLIVLRFMKAVHLSSHHWTLLTGTHHMSLQTIRLISTHHHLKVVNLTFNLSISPNVNCVPTTSLGHSCLHSLPVLP